MCSSDLGKAEFRKADLFETDFSKATVITMFLLPDINLKLRPKILNMKPGTRIVSNTFTMGEWKDDDTATVEENQGCSYYCTAHLWIVPAKVAGTWQMAQGELTLTQEFQMLGGSLKSGDKSLPLRDARMRGEFIHFNAGGVDYAGRVNGNSMSGTIGGAVAHEWTLEVDTTPPLPVRERSKSAADTPAAAASPVMWSPIPPRW